MFNGKVENGIGLLDLKGVKSDRGHFMNGDLSGFGRRIFAHGNIIDGHFQNG